MYGLTPQARGSLSLAKELGKGGEGSVFAVATHEIAGAVPASELVAKIYHDPTAENRAQKLKAMVSSPVNDPAVAWPLALVISDEKQFQGYLMQKLKSDSYREWLYVANAKDRRKVAPDFDVRYAFAGIRNLAAAVLAVHQAGHRIGDINESNIFLGADATVLIVDTDSMQISSADGYIFPCTVGKPEYTAPELSHGSLRDNPRTVESDAFAFAVATYQLITGGATPHQGAFDPNSDDDPLSTVERIRKGIVPNLAPEAAKRFGFTPRPGVPTGAFPRFLKESLLAFLSPDPINRNSGSTNLHKLIAELDAYIPTLTQCSRERHHWYPQGEQCLWCAEASRSGVDPWAGEATAPAQARLKPISFQDGSTAAAPQVNRAAAAVAGQQAHAANQHAGAGIPGTSAASASAIAAAAVQQYIQQTGGAGAAGAAAAPVGPQRPKKVKGKVTVEYADGSWSVRPPIGVLMRQRPKMAIWAIKEETPSLLKFWWPNERPLAHAPGLVVGLVFGLLIAAVWYGLAAIWLPVVPFLGPAIAPDLIPILSALPVATAIVASIWLFASGFRDRAVTKKRSGSLNGYKEETIWKTALRFIPLGMFYGVPILVVMAFGALFGLFAFVRAIGRA